MFVPEPARISQLAQNHRFVPVYREILADRLTPVSACECLAGQTPIFLLESVEGGERHARYSFIGIDPLLEFRSRDGIVEIITQDGVQQSNIPEGEDPLHALKRVLEPFSVAKIDGLPAFHGGAVGYMAYDLVRYFEKLPNTTTNDLNLYDCRFVISGSLLIFDHVKHRIKVVCLADVFSDPMGGYLAACERVDSVVQRLSTIIHPDKSPLSPSAASATMQNRTREDYVAAVRACIEYIKAGDVFQVVPSVRFSFHLDVDPFQTFRALRSVNPSPYMFFIDFGDEQVVGSSPEILVTVQSGRVRVRPIAGTRPRGDTDEKDDEMARDLLNDEKERSEHIMLIDLGRNDIGRVCEYGEVTVAELMIIERYSHVMHIVSDVTGKLASGMDVFDVTRATFPAGTLSGAPKVRAMEIIEEQEPTRRGLYGGAVGYFGFHGEMDFAIAIRTMLVKDGTAFVQVGAGIVADSDPESEYRECINKSQALFAAVEMVRRGLD